MEEIKEIAIIAGLSVWALLCVYVIRRVCAINREVKAKEDAERKSLGAFDKFKAGTLHPAQVFIDNELLQDSGSDSSSSYDSGSWDSGSDSSSSYEGNGHGGDFGGGGASGSWDSGSDSSSSYDSGSWDSGSDSSSSYDSGSSDSGSSGSD